MYLHLMETIRPVDSHGLIFKFVAFRDERDGRERREESTPQDTTAGAASDTYISSIRCANTSITILLVMWMTL